MKYSSLVNDIVVKTWSSGRFAPRLNHHLKELLTLEMFIGMNKFLSHAYATRYFGKLNELPKQALVSENCGNKQLYKLHLAKNEMMFFWLDMLGKHTCAFVMNIKFMMEFTNSCNNLCDFPLRLSGIQQDRRPKQIASLTPPDHHAIQKGIKIDPMLLLLKGRMSWLILKPCQEVLASVCYAPSLPSCQNRLWWSKAASCKAYFPQHMYTQNDPMTFG